MGIHRQVPDRLRQLHPRHGTLWVGIIIFGAIACLTLIPGQAEFLGKMYAFGAMLSFTIAHLAVIRLRAKVPDKRRPYRGPGNLRVRGVDVPLFAVVGGIGTLIALIVLTVLNTIVALAGIGWLVFGIFVYIWYRHRQGLDLTTTTRVAVPKPVVDREAEYESVLVAFDTPEFNADAIAIAVRLAARRRRGIHVLVTITVPASSPIDAQLPDQQLAAQEVIEQAKLQGGRRVTGHWVRVRTGAAGTVIVREAKAMRAQAIVMGLPSRPGGTLFGRTLETVLAQRPTRVIIAASPGRPLPASEEIVAAARR
jgi:APA family basic amino acid/polyamine antiporter